MVRIHHLVSAALAAAVAVPASAISLQSGPAPTGTTAQLAAPDRPAVDPDEQLERLSDQAQRAATSGSYENESGRSVMDLGSREATTNGGWQSFGR